VENNVIRIIRKIIPVLCLLLIIVVNDCSAQKKGFIIPVEKLMVDALDPAYAQVKPGDTLYFQQVTGYISISEISKESQVVRL
jgi:hypothetical protein